MGTTATHPFWSVDRQRFVEAQHLQPGETLRTLFDEHLKVKFISHRGPPEPVYNVTIHNEHTYFIGEDAVLVHNNDGYEENAANAILPTSVTTQKITKAEWKIFRRQSRIESKGGLPKTYREFLTYTQDRYKGEGHQATRGKAWAGYKKAHGIPSRKRSSSKKSAFLRGLAESKTAPKWMNQWLLNGKVPPGHEVDHILPLSIGGVDSSTNMRLLEKWFHDLHHKPGFYRPWE